MMTLKTLEFPTTYLFKGMNVAHKHPLTYGMVQIPPVGYAFSENPQRNQDTSKEINNQLSLLWEKCQQQGISSGDFNQFVNNRRPRYSNMVPLNVDMVWQDIPLYVGPNNWILWFEDWCHVTWPYAGNNHNCLGDIGAIPGVKILGCLFEMDNCRALMTHIKQNLESFQHIFGETAAKKLRYIPLGIPITQSLSPKNYDRVRILFTGSVNHTKEHFFMRGGLELVHAFNKACESEENIDLTIAYSNLSLDIKDLLSQNPKIRVLDTYLSDEEMHEELLNHNCYALHSFQTHSNSVVKALMNGLVVLCSNGWGFQEWITDNSNGLIAKGMPCSWTDELGIMRNKYTHCGYIHEEMRDNITNHIVYLANNLDKLEQMSFNARLYATQNISIENRNDQLKKLFDEVF